VPTDLMKQNMIGEMGGGLISQYKHSANLVGDDILGDRSSHLMGWNPTQGSNWCLLGIKPIVDSRIRKKLPFFICASDEVILMTLALQEHLSLEPLFFRRFKLPCSWFLCSHLFFQNLCFKETL